MTVDVLGIRWVTAQWLLSIWNPDLLNFILNPKLKRRLRLRYRTVGIVLHDRALNGGDIEVNTSN